MTEDSNDALIELFEKYPQIAASDKSYKNHPDDIDWTEEDWAKLVAAWEGFLATDNVATPQFGSDYSNSFDDIAIYTPALNTSYVGFVESNRELTSVTPFTAQDFNFLNPKSKLFYSPWALYSAGQAAKTKAAAQKDSWISKSRRHANTHVVGDSGGFQIQEDKIKFEGVSTLDRMLKWMEKTSEYSMILDFPTGGIEKGTIGQHCRRLESQDIDVSGEAKRNRFSKDYMTCLLQTEINNKYFESNRQPNATKLLNVIQGRNERESKFWYERMRDFKFEGIAFAGCHSVEFSITLRRIFQMLDYGLLMDCPWIHFLGVSTLRTAAALSYLQMELRNHPKANSKLQISFDSISSIKNLGFGYTTYTGYDFSPSSWRFTSTKLGIEKFNGDTRTLNEICKASEPERGKLHIAASSTIGNHFKPGLMMSLSKIRNENNEKYSLNTEGTMCLANHNMEVMIKGFSQINRFMKRAPLDMPLSIMKLKALMFHLFEVHKGISSIHSNVFDLIDECAPSLDELAIGGD